MSSSEHFLVVHVGDQRFAVGLERVERTIGAVEITPIPSLPAVLVGVIDVHGSIVPILNLGHRLGLVAREVEPSDQFVLIRTERLTIGILSDAVKDVIEVEPEAIVRLSPNGDAAPIAGTIGLEDGDIAILDTHAFLSRVEEDAAVVVCAEGLPERRPLSGSARERARSLRERAILLAKRADEDEPGSDETEVVIFSLGESEYAIECRHIRESWSVRDVTSLPSTPPHILGIVNLRGEIAPVVDLRRVLGLPSEVITFNQTLVVESDFGPVALHIDSINGVQKAAIEAEPLDDGGSERVPGISTSWAALLDIKGLIAGSALTADPEDAAAAFENE